MADSKVIEIIIRARNAATQEIQKLEGSLKRTTTQVKSLNVQLQKSALGLSIMGAAIAAPLTIGISKAAKLEKELSRVEAVSGATAAQMDLIKKSTLEMGRTTVFTATQAAQAMVFLSQAGLKTNQALQALPGTLELASAGELDLAEAADIATNVMAGYQMQVEKLPQINDNLAFTAANANTDVRQLAEALIQAGPAAKASNVPLEETNAILGGMANAGFRGAQAGTAFRRMLLKLQAPSDEARQTLKDLHIETRNADGSFRGLLPILKDMHSANMTLIQSERIFGIYAATAAVAASGQADAMQDLEDGLYGAAGAAKEMANVKLKNLEGQVTLLKSAVDGLFISMGDDLLPMVTELTKVATGFISLVSNIHNALGPVAGVLEAVTLAIGGMLVGLGSMAMAWKFALVPMMEFLSAVGGLEIFAGTVAALAGAPVAALVALAAEFVAVGVAVAKLTSLFGQHMQILAEGKALAEKYTATAQKYKEAKDVEIKATEDLLAMKEKERTAYGVSLEQAIYYYNNLWSAAKAAGKSTKEYDDKINELMNALVALRGVDPDHWKRRKTETEEATNAQQEFNKAIEQGLLLTQAMKAERDKTVLLRLKIDYDTGKINAATYYNERIKMAKEAAKRELQIAQDALDEAKLANDPAEIRAQNEKIFRIKEKLSRDLITLGEARKKALLKIDNDLAEAELLTSKTKVQGALAILEEQKRKGLVTIEAYYSRRLQLVRQTVEAEIKLLQDRANAETDPGKQAKLLAQIEAKKQAAANEEIRLNGEKQRSEEQLAQTSIELTRMVQDAEKRATVEGLTNLTAKHDQELAELQARHQNELAELDSYLADVNTREEAQDAKRKILHSQQIEEQNLLLQQTRETHMAMLDSANYVATEMGNVFASLYELTGKKIKAFFYMQKAAAIAQTIIETEKAAMMAMGQMGIFGIPMSALIRAKGYAAVATIMAQTISGKAEGGAIEGASPHPKADNILIRATAGEFMQPVAAVKYYGLDLMEKIRRMAIPRQALAGFASGGIIPMRPRMAFASGGAVTSATPGIDEKGTTAPAVNIANFVDPSLFEEYVASDEGQDLIINIVSKNRFQL